MGTSDFTINLHHCHIHPKLHNINLHNVTHFLIFQNPRERMFVVQISLLIVKFLSLISWILSLMQITREINPHPLIEPCVNMWSVFFFFFFYATCWMLVHAYAASSGKTKWSVSHYTIKMMHFVLFHSVTCYTNSIVSRVHINATKLRNTTCNLVATSVILRRFRVYHEWSQLLSKCE